MFPIIDVNHLSKEYELGRSINRENFREFLMRKLKVSSRREQPKKDSDRPRKFWGLNDISFEVAQGDVIGILGRNGAGKSTLLKIISKVTDPTRGTVTLRGRLGSLLEVGTGFHLELTGRENVMLSAAIMGMRRAEVQKRFDAIVEFADLAKFLETPVKRYSTGMYMRLACSVAALPYQ